MSSELEENLLKHEEILRYHKERVERDQRVCGLLPPEPALQELPKEPRMVPDTGGYFDQYRGPADFGTPGGANSSSGMMGGYQGGYQHNTSTATPTVATPGKGARATTATSLVSTPAMRSKDEPSKTRFLRQTPKATDPLRVYDRVSQWQRRKQQKLMEERRKHQDEEIANCPFAPITRADKGPAWEQKSGSIYGGNGRAWGYDEFVERQREARRRTAEKNETGKYTGKRWKNEVTVPVEFQLGRRDKSIKALQKPLSPPTFVPTVSEHHHLAKEMTALSSDSPLALFGEITGLPQRGLFSERISTAIIDRTMLHPAEDIPPHQQEEHYQSYSPATHHDLDEPATDWMKRSTEKQMLEPQLHAYANRPWHDE